MQGINHVCTASIETNYEQADKENEEADSAGRKQAKHAGQGRTSKLTDDGSRGGISRPAPTTRMQQQRQASKSGVEEGWRSKGRDRQTDRQTWMVLGMDGVIRINKSDVSSK